jgi:hypothetical protein
MENVPLFKSPSTNQKGITPQPVHQAKPVAQTFDRRERAESNYQNPDLKILIMNFDRTEPASHLHQQSNPTTPSHSGLLSSPAKIFNSMRSSNIGIAPN